MGRTFLRIIFLVFPFIFFGLVDSSFDAGSGENNQAWNTGEKKHVLKTKSLISKDTSSNNSHGDDILHLKLKGPRSIPNDKGLKDKIKQYGDYLNKKRSELNEMKDMLDRFHSHLGNAFSALVYVMRDNRDLTSPDYEFYLNKFFKLFKRNWGYIRNIEEYNSSIYSDILYYNKILSKLIIDVGYIKNDTRKEYNTFIRYLREVIDLINHNKGKNRSIRDYVKFVLNQAHPVTDLSEVKLKKSSDPSFNSVKSIDSFPESLYSANHIDESSTENNIFNIKVILLCSVSVLLIFGTAIYYILHKKK